VHSDLRLQWVHVNTLHVNQSEQLDLSCYKQGLLARPCS
jgi:hypothetical protein